MELNSNIFAIVLAVYAFISEVLPKFKSIEANSVYQLVLNVFTKLLPFLKEKKEVVPPVEPKL